ncbi:MAG: hypothetical protein ABFS32_14470 [Bacteroidota bacterium]
MKISNTHFPSHFQDFINALNKFDVEYMLIGGYAMGSYGHIRSTRDMDIYINTTLENAKSLKKACIYYGIREGNLDEEMFLVPKMVGIGDPPLRIKLLKEVGIVDFKYAFKRSIRKKVEGLEINVIGLEDLELLKKEAIKSRKKSRDEEDLKFIQSLKNRDK